MHETNDQDFHQPYWKSSQIELCQTPTNKIQHDTTTVSCNKQISKITFFYENLKQYLSRIFQHPTSNETSHETQDLESEPTTQVQNANQLTEQQVRLHLFLPQGPENHLQAQKYQPKIWNNHIDPVNHTYTSQRQIQLIMTPTKKTEPTTTIR